MDEATVEFNRALQRKTRYDGPAHINLGKIYLQKGLFNKAEAEFKRAIITGQYYEVAYGELGDLYMRRGLDHEAIEMFKKVLEINPNRPEVLVKMAHIYYEQKRYSLAVDCANKAIAEGAQVDENFLNILVNAGR